MIPATIRPNPTPDLAAEIKAIKTRVNAARRDAENILALAVVQATEQFTAATGLHITGIDVQLISHHDGRNIDCVLLSNVQVRHNLEV